MTIKLRFIKTAYGTLDAYFLKASITSITEILKEIEEPLTENQTGIIIKRLLKQGEITKALLEALTDKIKKGGITKP